MRTARLLALIVLLPFASTATRAAEESDDWKLIGGVLALMQQFVHLAAHSSDPKALESGVDAVFSGQNAQANWLASGVMDEVLQEVPAEHRSAFVAIGRDLLTLARRERAHAAAQAPAAVESSNTGAMQARRDLHAMGLRYWDEQQFIEAVKRGDRIAVDLYLAAQGLGPASTPRNLPPAR